MIPFGKVKNDLLRRNWKIKPARVVYLTPNQVNVSSIISLETLKCLLDKRVNQNVYQQIFLNPSLTYEEVGQTHGPKASNITLSEIPDAI